MVRPNSPPSPIYFAAHKWPGPRPAYIQRWDGITLREGPNNGVKAKLLSFSSNTKMQPRMGSIQSA